MKTNISIIKLGLELLRLTSLSSISREKWKGSASSPMADDHAIIKRTTQISLKTQAKLIR